MVPETLRAMIRLVAIMGSWCYVGWTRESHIEAKALLESLGITKESVLKDLESDKKDSVD